MFQPNPAQRQQKNAQPIQIENKTNLKKKETQPVQK
jgi:hypothetical protein